MNVPKGRSSTGTTQTALSEINVTPFVDVMLVLLIVFMISAPLMQQGIQVDLPKANAGSVNESQDPITLTVRKDLKILISDKVVPKGKLRQKLQAIAQASPDIQVFVQADQSIPYGYIARVIAEVKQSNIHRVGLITEPSEKQSRL